MNENKATKSPSQKRLVVLGAGESGTGAAILAQQKGLDTFVSDTGTINDTYKALLNQHNIQWEEGEHTNSLILNADEIVKSPGIPDNAPIIIELHKKGIPVISEIEFAARYTHAKMICITGSNGKTTTTSLLFDMLCRAGLNVGLAGNIGNSLALQVAQQDRDYYVIELSSFQLDNMYDFKADIAILMNITPDHLDRYDFCFQKYVDAKFRITQNQSLSDAFIYWSEDPVIDNHLSRLHPTATLYPFGTQKEHNVAYIDKERFILEAPNAPTLAMPAASLALHGIHNQLNSMAAGLAAQVLRIKNEVIRESLMQFKGVEHRLQYVATVRNIRFINDSKATNVNSCWYALESMTTPTVLILGGKDKGNDYAEIDALVQQKCHTLVFMGLHNEKLHEHFDNSGLHIIDTDNIHDAVQLAYQAANEGDTVLLSPCCASFDLFRSYEDRGEQFMNEVRTL
ncbi:MAG: UDP-N-acetylmuramoyl-L-alanine--D-glutamate ligase [Paludibacter sp.]|nr:UDP-N-acetylmuramoyl-L-alanine--D-glutamate ligase [Bacteroidales bacterium]MCM1068350.1 UDP-N-acetylmuramoyl-L-alanine--D-glutamate ligase [Prevotella sp.]MCM1354022.1 UDP-N-acetylmuramoyl-L-alanine--D-glutamate ligase [Bacteroides sp.]MCM1442136.1 UDP-N-acetylmuramoyl-L-alanine--D-glutamate ligase [Muribaculum sp.]MCM1481971.1 UDP-N-acetylmuramoyl-L-alanine--D-glutamate ligase [Paludibacter sp.]